MMLTPLLNRADLYPDESLDSLVTRLHLLNYYNSFTVIKRICEQHIEQELGYRRWVDLPQMITLLSQLSLLPETTLHDATEHRFVDVLIPPPAETKGSLNNNIRLQHLWGKHTAQFCPQCVADDPHHKVSWTPMVVSACLKHQCLLARHCPSCDSPIKIQYIVLDACHRCGEKLSDAETHSIEGDEWGIQTQATIQSWFSRERGTAEHSTVTLPQHPNNVLYGVLYGLMMSLKMQRHKFQQFHQTPFPAVQISNQNKQFLHSAHYYTLTATAMRGIDDWPYGFYRLLDEIRQSATSVTGRVSQDFGRLYSGYLEKSWRHEAFQFVQDAFNHYLQTHYPMSPSILHLRRFRDNPDFAKPFPYITEVEASRQLKVSTKTITKLTEQGMLTSHKEAYPNGSVKWFKLVKRDDVVALKKQWERGQTLKATATELGIYARVVVSFVEDGLLTALRGSTIDESQQWLIDRSSIRQLKERLYGAAENEPFVGMIRLQKAVQTLAPHHYNTAKLLHLILDGRIRAFWVTDRLIDMAVSADDIKRVLAEIPEKRPQIPRSQFARMMSVKRLHIIDQWVENGLITPVRITGSGTYFDREDVEAFVHNYLCTDEAAEILGIGVLSVQKWARLGRLHPVSGGEVDGLHRYLFRRSEIERFRPSNRLTAPQMAERLGIGRSQMVVRIQNGTADPIPISGPGIDDCKHYLFLADTIAIG